MHKAEFKIPWLDKIVLNYYILTSVDDLKRNGSSIPDPSGISRVLGKVSSGVEYCVLVLLDFGKLVHLGENHFSLRDYSGDLEVTVDPSIGKKDSEINLGYLIEHSGESYEQILSFYDLRERKTHVFSLSRFNYEGFSKSKGLSRLVLGFNN
jgi:hypothetical protein